MIFATSIPVFYKRLSLIGFLWILTLSLTGQDRTVGVFLNDSLSLNGYTLFAPTGSNDTYLIDNCGHVVNTWTSNFRPGLSVYLLEDGSLLRPCRINSEFNAGGTAGRVEKYNWEGEMLWGYNYSSDFFHQHHDIAPMPNGNLLILAWERKSKIEAVAAGRNPASIIGDEIWSEHIVEWKVDGGNDPEIVWEWHVWDHLIQDFDSGKENFGVVAEQPDLFDINYINGGGQDWLHANAIDYNPELDQIIISSRNWGEFWIIDHSTTIEEAANNTGGNLNKGGTILYRWGNPQTYDRGMIEDQKLFGQHNVTWVPKGKPGEGNILVFNNGLNRFDGNYSTVDEIAPPVTSEGGYTLEAGKPFGPAELLWTYPSSPDFDFFAGRVSGAQRLENGNTLICDGTSGRFFEVTSSEELVWDYINPVVQGNPIVQGNTPNGNDAFRVTRYPITYPAFIDRDLTPGALIELEPLEDTCGETMVRIVETKILVGLELFPNPVEDLLHVQNKRDREILLNVTALTGKKYFQTKSKGPQITIATSEWPVGIYFVQIYDTKKKTYFTQKIIKQ